MAREDSVRSVAAAFAANATIAVAKGTAALLTGSPSLLAETLHTIADAGNEVLLWIALRRSVRPADASHPYGYGPERWYWALLAAIGMFAIGGALSLWEGIHALIHPPGLDDFWIGVVVLVIALTLDGASRVVAVRGLRRQAAERGVDVQQLLRESTDPTIVTVYLEDTIDVLGAALALIALVAHRLAGTALPDALASIVIGGLLGYVAIRLIERNRRLLANQGVPERYVNQLRERICAEPGIQDVTDLQAVYLGPSDVLVTAEVLMEPCQSGEALVAAIDRVRGELLRDVPAISRLYLTPVDGRP